MQSTIIALTGIANAGKSTTISLAYRYFRHDGATVIYEGPERQRQNGPPEVKGAVLEIDGVLVGFTSPGDTPDHLLRPLETLIARGCVVIVCATHTRRSETVTVVEELANKHNYRIEWVEKTRQDSNHYDNQQKANEIVELIRGIIEDARLVEA